MQQREEYDFDNGLARKPYFAFLEQLAEKHVLYDYSRYKNDGFMLFYNLEADQCSTNVHLNPVRHGNLRLQLKSRKLLPEPVTVLFVSETPRILRIDGNRTVSID